MSGADKLSRDKLSLEVLIEEYDAYLSIKKGRARTDAHRRRVKLCLTRMLWGADGLDEVTADWIERRMHDLMSLPVAQGSARRVSRNTVDLHRCVLSTFFKWLIRKKRIIRENPVDFVDSYAREDARGVARPFALDELAAFWRAVPPERELIYAVWAMTGLRPLESARLLWNEVIFDPAAGGPPYLVLHAASTKNGRREHQPLHARLVALLRKARALDPAGVFVFRRIPNNKTFARDLRKAGLYEARETAEGTLTRYSLRKTFITAIVSDEKNSQVAHKLARHSDPKLTYGTYTSFDLRRKAEALSALEALFPERAA